MSEMKHTEGPWEVDGFAIVGGGQTICLMGEIDGFERGYAPCKNDGPNSKLITAAPDLLAALGRLDAYWLETFPGGPDGDVSYAGGIGQLADECVDLWRDIRAAIAKARS